MITRYEYTIHLGIDQDRIGEAVPADQLENCLVEWANDAINGPFSRPVDRNVTVQVSRSSHVTRRVWTDAELVGKTVVTRIGLKYKVLSGERKSLFYLVSDDSTFVNTWDRQELVRMVNRGEYTVEGYE